MRTERSVLWIYWGGGSLDLCLGDLRNGVSDSPCLSEFSTENQYEHPPAGSGWQWATAQVFSHLKTVSIWDTPPPSLDTQFANQNTLSSKREMSRPALVALPTGLTWDKKRDTPLIPDNCRHQKHNGRGTSQHTSFHHPIWQGLCLPTYEIYTRYILAVSSGNSIVCMASVWFQILTCM